jgi:hypothetical protein
LKAETARRELQKRLKKLDAVRQCEQWTNLALALDTWLPSDLIKLERHLRGFEDSVEIHAEYLGPDADP